MPWPSSNRLLTSGRTGSNAHLVGQPKSGEKGMVLLVSAMMLVFVVIPVVGLAIDAGILYAVKAKLQTAADGAALGAVRSLSRGLDLISQEGAATNTATRWYHANFPVNWMGVVAVADPTITFPPAPPKTTIVTVSGNVLSPTYFMRIFNVNSVAVNVMGQATRRDVNIMMVIDRSGSLYASGSCPSLQSASSSFVNSFVNGRDRLGLITFGTDYRLDFPPNMTFATGSPNMATMVNQIVCYGYTNAAAAYWAAYQQLVLIGDVGALNVLLFFTDGQPNTLTFGIAPDGTDNRLPVKTLTTPSTLVYGGYDNGNRSLCKDALGRASSSGSWNPSNFSGVISFAAGIYKKDALGFPASQSQDAQKIGVIEGNNGGCAFDAQFANTGTIYYGGSPNAPIAGPGFFPAFDVAYLPNEDINRNLTGNGYIGSAFVPVNRYDNGFPPAYRGKIRVDDIGRGCCTLGVDDSITNAGINALDNAAQRARADSMTRNLNVVTYTIGLGNAPGGVNDQLLQRIANDPNALNFNSSQPAGEYVFSPTTAQLNQAFNKIASDVLRISK